MTITPSRGPGLPVAAPPDLEAVALTRSFGAVLALDHAGFAVPAARLSALVGPAGCGKTTLLRVVAGLLAPDSGHVRIAGVDTTTDAHQAHRLVGLVPERPGLWPELTPRAVVRALGAAHRLPPAVARRGTEELLDFVGLGPAAERVGRLDPTQRRRLALAQALIHSPDVLLVDDPRPHEQDVDEDDLADVAEPDALDGLLRTLAADGLTVLVATRDADRLGAHRLLHMESGRIVAAHDNDDSPAHTRWRVTVLDVQRARAVLTARGTTFADVHLPGDWGARGAVDVSVADERDAAALLAMLVAEDVAVFGFAPAATTRPERRAPFGSEAREGAA